jgi:hypothetical protein
MVAGEAQDEDVTRSIPVTPTSISRRPEVRVHLRQGVLHLVEQLVVLELDGGGGDLVEHAVQQRFDPRPRRSWDTPTSGSA